ncbi:uncharacterized protein LOC117111738, partial [Anneissia japonica]|uniref:uncharacterized protein LOC117111738 n=1 Tax=Anneissia japonica TaxID=1529436 RepID=UPI0014255830
CIRLPPVLIFYFKPRLKCENIQIHKIVTITKLLFCILQVNELEYSLKQAEDEKELLEFQLLETSEGDDIIETGSPRASTPRIMITHHLSTDGAGLQYACTLDSFD